MVTSSTANPLTTFVLNSPICLSKVTICFPGMVTLLQRIFAVRASRPFSFLELIVVGNSTENWLDIAMPFLNINLDFRSSIPAILSYHSL